MSKAIPVGQSALVIAGDFRPDRIGQVCVILEPYEWRECRLPNGTVRLMCRYLVEFPDGEQGAYSYRNLMPFGDREVVRELECSEAQREVAK